MLGVDCVCVCVCVQEKQDKAMLQEEVQHLRQDNMRLHEESLTASAQLRKFTEWFFHSIDKKPWEREKAFTPPGQPVNSFVKLPHDPQANKPLPAHRVIKTLKKKKKRKGPA